MLSALAHLSQLTQLQLQRVYSSSSSSSSNNSNSLDSVAAHAIAGLINLRSLELTDVPLAAAAAAQLGTMHTAAGLTKLQLRDCELEDDVLLAAVRGMQKLQSLDVSENLLLTDSALAAVAAQLPRLVQLNVTLTGITRDACSSLQDSRPGLKVLARRPALAAPMVLTLWGDPPEPSPQKPRGAYMWFCKRARPAVMLAYPDWGSALAGKELCRLWSAASSAEKQRYERLADADKASYEQEMAFLQQAEERRQSAAGREFPVAARRTAPYSRNRLPRRR
uniref:HMG box domain-containing protein n=1 Tax=Tetradesmus obliquus TaxID=3088 RepID=A0A383VPD0_TETOB|eukprot:jgi/Sobl393_1/708/SZX67388.1